MDGTNQGVPDFKTVAEVREYYRTMNRNLGDVIRETRTALKEEEEAVVARTKEEKRATAEERRRERLDAEKDT